MLSQPAIILTQGQPVLALTLKHQEPDRVASRKPTFKLLVWLPSRTAGSEPIPPALEVNALPLGHRRKDYISYNKGANVSHTDLPDSTSGTVREDVHAAIILVTHIHSRITSHCNSSRQWQALQKDQQAGFNFQNIQEGNCDTFKKEIVEGCTWRIRTTIVFKAFTHKTKTSTSLSFNVWCMSCSVVLQYIVHLPKEGNMAQVSKNTTTLQRQYTLICTG